MLRNFVPIASRVSARAITTTSQPPKYTQGQGELEQNLKDALHRKSAAAASQKKQTRISQADAVREENDYHESMLGMGGEYIVGGENEMVGGYPEMQRPLPRVAHIYQQKDWNTTAWKIDLADDDYMETRLGGPSFGDLLPNISMHMKFSSKEDAIDFCKENNWKFQVLPMY